jgi:hypothetical protein
VPSLLQEIKYVLEGVDKDVASVVNEGRAFEFGNTYATL